MLLKLREYRMIRRMTISDLSRSTGISRTYIRDIEHDRYNPSVTVVCLLCKALGITPNDIIPEIMYK